DNTTNGTPTELRGNLGDLGAWTVGSGLKPLTSLGAGIYSVTHTFPAYDTLNGSANGTSNMAWKIGWGSTWENNGNHTLDDDVIDNSAVPGGVTLTWTSNDSQGF